MPYYNLIMGRTQKHASGRHLLRTPEIRQARVIASKLAGKSNRGIAREEGLDQHTVARILSQPLYQQIIQEVQDQVVQLLPDSVKVLSEELKKRKAERVRVALAILHGKQILVNREARETRSRETELADLSTDELYEVAAAVAGRIQELIRLG